MLDHISSYAIDYDKSKAFYDATLAVLGYEPVMHMTMDWDEELPGRRATAYGPAGNPTFWVIETKVEYTPRHIAFVAPDRSAVTRFHEVGLTSGGRDHGAPGPRPIYHEHYFGSFLLDPDGNNVEAVCHTPA